MEVACNKTIPQITLLKGPENLKEWKLQVHEVLKFYGLEEHIPGPSGLGRKRKFNGPGHETFVLGLITASVSPVAGRLVDFGWDFSKQDQNPMDLYHHTLKFVVPATEQIKAVRLAVRFLAAEYPPSASGQALRSYRRRAADQKRVLEAFGYPLDDKIATCLVLDALRNLDSKWHQELAAKMLAGELTWDKLMDKIDARSAEF